MTERGPISQRCRGRIPATVLVFLGSVGMLVVLMWMLLAPPKRLVASQGLVVYCAAGLKGPVAAVAQAFEKELGIPVHLSYAGSGELLANMEVSRRGDLYLPADDRYIALAREKRLVRETLPLARMQAVLVVGPGNPRQVRSIADLERAELRLAHANPEAAAVGKVVKQVLEEAGLWQRIEPQIKVFKPTVNQVAADIKLGTVDAGFIWDALLPSYAGLEVVPVGLLTNAQGHITIGVLSDSTQPAAALQFARYLNAPEKGGRQWTLQGFRELPGDPWAPHPQLKLMSGAMLRPAIEETLQEFERREGVEITRVYNGCGILVSQMKAGEHPDAYFSCDTSFMEQVADLFLPSEDISGNQLVIAVPKGNPRNLQSLGDLGQPNLRVGVGHPLKGAMGALTRKMLLATGTLEAVQPNITVESPTGDFLINQLRTGALDAAIAYLSNTALSREVLDAVPLNLPTALATQPVAVGRHTPYAQTLRRLMDAIKTAESKARFESYGFEWKAPEPDRLPPEK